MSFPYAYQTQSLSGYPGYVYGLHQPARPPSNAEMRDHPGETGLGNYYPLSPMTSMISRDVVPLSPLSHSLMPPPPNRLTMDYSPIHGHGSRSSPPSKARENIRFMPRTSRGHWQSPSDLEYRRIMIVEIANVLRLQEKERHASEAWLRKLPSMVKQLEVSLYKSAASLEAYCDLSTLRWRLQQLKEEIAMRRHAEAILELQKKVNSECESRGEGQDMSRSSSP